jgi:hypothetical protein
MQSVGEREIIKTAPDVICYVEGRPYLINKFINDQDIKNQSNGQYTVVNFNDFVDSFSTSYDIDNLIPAATITLSVPNNLKRLFQAPAGGENVLETMMEVQVFAKGYFPSPRGNTLYYRVFKGMISTIGYSDTGTSLQISIGCSGTLRFLELMQVDLAAALLSNAPVEYLTPYSSNAAQMDPYKQLADMFLRSVTPAGFQLNSLAQAQLSNKSINPSDWYDVVQGGYIMRWQARLINLIRDVRILGYDMKNSPVTLEDDPYLILNVLSAHPSDAEGKLSPELRAARLALLAKDAPGLTRLDPNLFINTINKYLPDFGVGNIQLLNGKITSRIERVRNLVHLLLYEGYQDIDGAIIFKPPLYNLDVTNVGQNASNTSTTSSANYITEATNPFVVHLSEIESESETEDEHAIKATRTTIQGGWLTDFQFNSEMAQTLTPAADYMDIAKMSKFGLREEPARTLGFLRMNDPKLMYAYAASETTRANRGYRSYTVTIPLRPELRLGFPMYFPHKDMYGYIRLVSINYQQGQSATMSITLDTIRKRPLISSTSTTNGKTLTSYTSQPNLVYQWTKPPTANQPAVNPPTWVSQSTSVSSGTTVTARPPKDAPFSSDEWAYIMHQKETIGNVWSSRWDTKDKCYRLQNDKADQVDADTFNTRRLANETNNLQTGVNPYGNDGGPTMQAGEPFFSGKNWLSKGIDIQYLEKILETQPYTDDKGYEVATPFPWGRWMTLTDAIRETRLGILTPDSANSLSQGTLDNVNVFLFAGMATPNDPSITGQLSTSDMYKRLSSSDVAQTMSVIYDSVELDSVIELVTPQEGQPGDASNLTSNPQPDMLAAGKMLDSSLTDIKNSVQVFLTGGVSSTDTQVIKQVANAKINPNVPVPSLPPFIKNLLPGGNS